MLIPRLAFKRLLSERRFDSVENESFLEGLQAISCKLQASSMINPALMNNDLNVQVSTSGILFLVFVSVNLVPRFDTRGDAMKC